MPIPPVKATDYVSLDQLMGGGNLSITKLSPSPADVPTTKGVQRSNPTNPPSTQDVASTNPADGPSVRDVSRVNPAGFPSIDDIAMNPKPGKRLDTQM